jgi:hypothetical protein
MKDLSTTSPNVSSTSSQLEVILSRTCYRVGGTLVGSLRLIIPFSDPSPSPLETSVSADNNSSGISRNSYWEEATVHARGQCRLDPRWHNPLAYDQYRNLSSSRTDMPREQDDPNVCTVWKTNTVSLLTLTERKLGKWHRVRPRPLSMPPENPEHYFTECINDYENLKDDDESEDPSLNLENRQLCVTFRVHLPEDLIPSVSLTCCRYSYHIHVEAKTKTGIHLVEQIPFTVWSALSPREIVTLLPKIDGQCLAMAHSSGLPCYLSTDEIYAPQGQTTVINRNSKWDTKNLRITDPSGNHCCQVTAFGSQIMSPGVGQLLLQFDFDADTTCYGVSACLESEEIALRHYTERAKNSGHSERERERRTSTQWWDTQHEPVEPGFTDCVTLRLHLPPESPISVMTDVVRLQYVCRIDITVSTSPAGRFTSFSWTLPVHVVHPATAEELEQSHVCNRDPWETDDVWNKEASEPITSVKFPTQDIMVDLKILSRILLEKCDLLRESRRFEV